MSEDFIFASEEEAVQHLANLTGKRIKIAADYVYKNKDDSIRVRLFNRGGWWDADIFFKDKSFSDKNPINWSNSVGDKLKKKDEMKAQIEEEYGKLKSLGYIQSVTEGWE